MSIFTKLTIGGRLRLAFGGLFGVLMFVGGVDLYQARQIFDVSEDLGNNRVPSLVLLGRLYKGGKAGFSAFTKVRDALHVEMDYNERQGKISAVKSGATFTATVWIIGALTAFAGILVVVVALWLNKNVTARVVRLAGAMRQLALRNYVFELPCVKLMTRLATWLVRWTSAAQA